MDQHSYNERNTSTEETNSESHSLTPWVERNGFAHWAVALGWVLVALVAFNIIGGIVAVIVGIATSETMDVAALMEQLQTNYTALFIGNSAGQVAIFLVATLLLAKIHAVKGRRFSFLRLNISNKAMQVTVLSAILLVAVQPAIILLGWINSFVPVPQFFAEMQDSMMELITEYLRSDRSIALGVFYIGVIPAVCEEIMYRGYVMRCFEKSWGIKVAIIVSGFIFGAYHLQPSNLLPLTALGIIFAYITYVSDSLIPAIVAHLLNNGGQVVASSYYPEMLDQEITPDMELPWMLIMASLIISTALLYFIGMLKTKNKDEV